ncbi:zinc finger protein with KRAB and SCAN domains 5-like [Elgaria multicarinata webbii]|uniref:zinc finger protein with KRAB and SCAN domains 5-like n=1 Tax=Elgaria multicarinata webbii TaxID=159646 RepID=UPI002FCCF456
MAVEQGDVSALRVKLKAAWGNGMKVEELEAGGPEAENGRLAVEAGNTRGFWERTIPLQVKQEPNEERQQCWETQLQGFVRALESPHLHRGESQLPQATHGGHSAPVLSLFGDAADLTQLPGAERMTPPPPGLCTESHMTSLAKDWAGCGEVKEEEPPDGETFVTDLQRRRFRRFSYREAEGPGDVCRRLRELCHRWLMPERRTKEQIVELVVLEQFLAVLPGEIQSRIRAWELETCSQAVTLAERFLQQEEKGEEQVKALEHWFLVQEHGVM